MLLVDLALDAPKDEKEGTLALLFREELAGRGSEETMLRLGNVLV